MFFFYVIIIMVIIMKENNNNNNEYVFNGLYEENKVTKVPKIF